MPYSFPCKLLQKHKVVRRVVCVCVCVCIYSGTNNWYWYSGGQCIRQHPLLAHHKLDFCGTTFVKTFVEFCPIQNVLNEESPSYVCENTQH